MTACCSPRAPHQGGCRFRAPSSTASTTCATSRRRRPRRPPRRRRTAAWSAAAGSVPRSPPPRGRRASRSRSSSAPVPLERVLGAEVGQIYADIHPDHGVELLTGAALERFEGAGSRGACPPRRRRTLDADFVVVGIGVVPRTALAERPASRRQRHPGLPSGSRPAPPASSRPATSRTPTTRSTSGDSESSTGPTRSTSRRRRPERCSASPRATTGCPTSSPTSTTSVWSTRVRHELGRGRLPRRPGERRVHRLLARPRPRRRGMNVNVWDVTADPGTDPRPPRGPGAGCAISDVPLDSLMPTNARPSAARQEVPNMNRLSHLRARACRSGSTRSHVTCRRRRVRRLLPRPRRDRRDLEPDDLREGDLRLRPLRRAARGAAGGGIATRRALPRARAGGRPPRRALMSPAHEASRGPRRLRVVRSARRTSPTTPARPSPRRASCGIGSSCPT